MKLAGAFPACTLLTQTFAGLQHPKPSPRSPHSKRRPNAARAHDTGINIPTRDPISFSRCSPAGAQNGSVVKQANSSSDFELLPFLLPTLGGSHERLLYIKPDAGTSNRMLALASAIGLAMVTQRTPVVVWKGLFKYDRFGCEPPPGIRSVDRFPTAPPDCALSLTHNGRTKPCWASLVDYSAASMLNMTNLMSPCKNVYIDSQQYFLPMLLNFHVKGKPLGYWLGTIGSQPFTAMASRIFRPDPRLVLYPLS
mmetsp:Transcript_25787/g.57810  ORF Transcript_25787/g.57810 Transcript_25787/m.57810 type:complete len:253 (+) Transcript_25787:32-790(+)